ncbi:hypothetical protein RR48_08246 [Papilio machaon]|uniref:Uncharacterized protein n=1 Tax=Papilio machaon TaxID=76193 RepID=A0A194RJW4_PAPMA|nr:hypothetical protein RR48_08246 [Papilio machaon]
MLCSARCSCFLCRELQSCRAADARKPPNKHNMADNFILKKAEAWEPIKFIRGAARLSVRHWQSREPQAHPKARIATHKSTSCEQLYPKSEDEPGPYPLRKAPSTDRIKPHTEHKPLFKLLGNARPKKVNNNDPSESKVRRSVLNFKKSEGSPSKSTHEKYIPLPQVSHKELIYNEQKPWASQLDDCCRPPVYKSVEKKRDDTKGSVAEKKIYNNRPPCYEELAERLSQDKNKKAKPAYADGGLANKITQNNNKVVIYFGDSIIRKHSEQKKEEKETRQKEATPPKDEAIYVNRVVEDATNVNVSREEDKGGTQMISEIEVPEAIYSEINPEGTLEVPEVTAINDATYKKDVFESVSPDGFLVVEFEGNFERALQLVELVHGGGERHEATMLDDEDQCDWSFIQDWRKRPSSGCRPSEEASWSGVAGVSSAVPVSVTSAAAVAGAGGVAVAGASGAGAVSSPGAVSGAGGARALRVRVSGGAAPAHARRLSPPPPAHRATTPPPPSDLPNKSSHDDCGAVAEAQSAQLAQSVQLAQSAQAQSAQAAQLKPVAAVSQLTVASAPVRSAPAQSSHALDRRARHEHHHRALDTAPQLQLTHGDSRKVLNTVLCRSYACPVLQTHDVINLSGWWSANCSVFLTKPPLRYYLSPVA